MGALERSLAAAGVDPSLLPLAASVSGDVHSDAFYGSPYAVFKPCNSWTNKYDQALCGSVFLGNTPLYEYNCSPFYAIVIFDGLMEVLDPAGAGCTVQDHSGWWWGQNIPFQNVSNSTIYYGH